MNIYIAHYHLNPGGVTRIIQSQIMSLKQLINAEDIVVITGGLEEKKFFQNEGIEVIINPDFLYFTEDKIDETHKTHSRLLHFFDTFLQHDDIIHFHNLNLGKNPVVTFAIYQLARSGFPVFNHVHDFAEDRPQNWDFLKEIIENRFNEDLRKVMYPSFSNYLFGVLNQFDKQRLINFGLKPDRIQYLPNPVNMNETEEKDKEFYYRKICQELNIEQNKPIITYPVRVIRRKNIGEFILLAALFREDFHWVVTQPPKNPVEKGPYDKWVQFCQEYRIPVIFEAGNRVDFFELMYASSSCITTSYREGFGMAFLEPWLLDTPVIGRNIDYATRDFLENGIAIPHLYNRLLVHHHHASDDFKNFDDDIQREIIKETLQNPVIKKQLFENNPVLEKLNQAIPQSVIDNNKTIIKNNYSIQKYGELLSNAYQRFF